ncbi:MAG: Na/Pi cotransporter family protein [Treponema sp.]|nr:Na/Pi cotransporter family protein [Treponema sp.]
MNIISLIFQLGGSLGFLLFGMKLMSNGIQKSTGNSLKKALNLMTSNRLLALITGMMITMIIQSSGATTVMVVTFVNAGLLTLEQSVGVIFGANIGTTITAWIVSLFGFNFDISSFAIPIFGIGFLLHTLKKLRQENLGEALMGFAMLFMGLDMLSGAISPDSGNLNFISVLDDWGFISIIIGVVIGLLITALLHSSSAATAIVITLAYNKLISWDFSASLVIGSEIGSTIDAVLAAWGNKENAKQAAFIHVTFNVVMAFFAIVFFIPLLRFVDILVPGAVQQNENISFHIAALHTLLKTMAALVFLPFTKQFAAIAKKFIKTKENAEKNVYTLEFSETGGRENVVAYIVQAEKEIFKMADNVAQMFRCVQVGFSGNSDTFVRDYFDMLTQKEDYVDQMEEALTKYLVSCSKLPLTETQTADVARMMQIVEDIESMSDECYSIGVMIKKSVDKDMKFSKDDLEKLQPYLSLAGKAFDIVHENLDSSWTAEELASAEEIEKQIDAQHKALKKIARKRLEGGAEVKTELMYIDLVRQIEKFGDHAYRITSALGQAAKQTV